MSNKLIMVNLMKNILHHFGAEDIN